MIGFAVPAGANRPSTCCETSPGTPASTAVGMSGASGRNVWRNRNARRVRDRQQAQLTGTVELQHLVGHRRDEHWYLATHCIGHAGAGAAVRHVRKIGDAGERFEELAAKMVQSDARR